MILTMSCNKSLLNSLLFYVGNVYFVSTVDFQSIFLHHVYSALARADISNMAARFFFLKKIGYHQKKCLKLCFRSMKPEYF